MVKGKVLSLVLVFMALTILSVMFISNLGEMRTSYTENTTFAETGKSVFDLFSMMNIFIVPLSIMLGVFVLFLMIKWAFSNVGGNY